MNTRQYIKSYFFMGAKIITAYVCVVLFNGCDSFVEVDQPKSQLTATAVFDSKTTADAAMADVYSQIRENGILSGKLSGISNLLGNYADELVSYESGSYSSEDFYNNALLASNPIISSIWNASYNQIYAANAVYEGVGRSAALNSADKAQLQGEALFVRALNHFYLVNIFGDVPYISTTDYVQNSTVTRMPAAEVYSKVIADLAEATGFLPDAYLSDDRVRPNKSAAQALLARVYLYNGQWAEAADLSSAVLNNSALYIWETNIDNIFLKGSTTTIWQLAPAYEGYNTDEGMAFIFPSGPPMSVALSESLVSQFEAGDLRRTHWIGEVTDGTDTWYHAFKYKEAMDTGSSVEYSIVLRLAEQYLIRSEARARQGDLIGAKEDLNVIRQRAGLADTDAVSGDAILEAILHERRAELFTEHGHRFFDLKRFGRLDSVLSAKPGWNSTDLLWPLPQSELLVNPFLRPQNAGY